MTCVDGPLMFAALGGMGVGGFLAGGVILLVLLGTR